TMVPPSLHPSGERVVLRSDGDIHHDDSIGRRCALYASACCLFFHLGHRGLLHEARLALAGFLMSSGCSSEETIAVGEAIAHAAGNNVADVLLAVQTTEAKLKASEPVQGYTVLSNLLGDDGKKILARIRDWLGGNEFITGKKDEVLKDNQENI